MPGSPSAAARLREKVTIGVRPEALRLVPPGHSLPLEAVMVEELGADSFVHGVSEIDAERINIRETNGKLRLAIANTVPIA